MHERWLEITMPSFSDEFQQQLHKQFLTRTLTAKELEEWTEWQLENYLKLSKQALIQEEKNLIDLMEAVIFTKQVIKNLKNRIEILDKTIKEKE